MDKMFWPDEDPARFTIENFESFIQWCFDAGASDILIEAGEVLGVKLHGETLNVGKRLTKYEEAMEILRSMNQAAASAVLKSPKEMNFKHSVLRDDDSLINFRVNATGCESSFGYEDGVEIVLRTIQSDVPKYSDLDIPDEIIDLCSAKAGIILVSGPTGSGKSNTIASMLREIIETKPVHILTYESPIESLLKSIPNKVARVVQMEIPTHLESYRAATENSLRKAPDVIFHGEAKNEETMAACIRDAKQGHLILTTVHANSVAMTISRMAGEFGSSDEVKNATRSLVSTIKAIIHQRLYPRVGGGLVAIREYLVFTEQIRRHLQMALFSTDDLESEIQELLKKNGKPLISDAKEKFRKGIIDFSQYVGIVNEFGSKEDLSLIPNVAEDLLKKGIISHSDCESWIDEYNMYGGE